MNKTPKSREIISSASNPQDKSGNPAILKFGAGHSRNFLKNPDNFAFTERRKNFPDLTLKITNEKKILPKKF